MKNLPLLLILLLLVGCSTNDPKPTAQNIRGTWRLTEKWGWTGGWYKTTPIPARPLQTVGFTSGGKFTSQGADIEAIFGEYSRYEVDSSQSGVSLVLLEKRGKSGGYSVGMSFRNDTLVLSPTCYEGCRYSFVKIK